MLDIHAREITQVKRTASYVHLIRLVVVLSVDFKPGYRDALAEAANAVRSVDDSSTDFRNPASEVLFLKKKIVKKRSPWDQ